MILVLEDRYESLLSIDTKNTSSPSFDVTMTFKWRQSHEKLDFSDFEWK